MTLVEGMIIVNADSRGEKIRRSLSFVGGDVNRCIRSRYRVTDYFFALSERLRPEERFTRVCTLARDAAVELMTHAIVPEEQAFLLSDRYAGAQDLQERFSRRGTDGELREVCAQLV